MEPKQFKYSSDEDHGLSKEMTASDWKSILPQLTPSLLINSAKTLAKTAPERLHYLYEALENKHQCEQFGQSLDENGFMQLLDTTTDTDPQKLGALFAGIHPHSLQSALPMLSKDQLKILLKCGREEPLLHQLTLYSHAIDNENNYLYQRYAILKKIIDDRTSQLDLDYPSYLNITVQIDELSLAYAILQSGIRHALTVAWSSERRTLIDQLSRQKEFCDRMLSQQIGTPGNTHTSATGLYLELRNRVMSVYEGDSIEKRLFDNDPAIEALAALSIQYIEDFIELGLIKTKNETLHDVEKKLQDIGLFTLADVKKAQIFSKETLKLFITGNRKLATKKNQNHNTKQGTSLNSN